MEYIDDGWECDSNDNISSSGERDFENSIYNDRNGSTVKISDLTNNDDEKNDNEDDDETRDEGPESLRRW